MSRVFRSSLVVIFGLAIGGPAAGCSSIGESTEEAAASITAGLHEPQGAERKAIVEAFQHKLSIDLYGQETFFNVGLPGGRFLVHGDWAYLEGLIEGPNGITKPIDYDHSVYADEFAAGYLDGVEIG